MSEFECACGNLILPSVGRCEMCGRRAVRMDDRSNREPAAPVVWRGGAVVRNEYFYCKPTAQEHDDERIPEGLWEEFDDTFVYGAELIEIGEKALEENYGAMKEESNAEG